MATDSSRGPTLHRLHARRASRSTPRCASSSTCAFARSSSACRARPAAPHVDDAMAKAGVLDVATERIGHLSKGYRQRVGLADAIVARPPHRHPRRAHGRPRPQPDPRDARARARSRTRPHRRALDAHPWRGRGLRDSRAAHPQRQSSSPRGPPASIRDMRSGAAVEIAVHGRRRRARGPRAEGRGRRRPGDLASSWPATRRACGWSSVGTPSAERSRRAGGAVRRRARRRGHRRARGAAGRRLPRGRVRVLDPRRASGRRSRRGRDGPGGRHVRAFWPIFKRELFAFFVTPLAWVLIVAFLVVQGMHFFLLVDHFSLQADLASDETPLSAFFGNTVLLYLVLFLLVPPMTMRLFAEERRSGTIETPDDRARLERGRRPRQVRGRADDLRRHVAADGALPRHPRAHRRARLARRWRARTWAFCSSGPATWRSGSARARSPGRSFSPSSGRRSSSSSSSCSASASSSPARARRCTTSAPTCRCGGT